MAQWLNKVRATLAAAHYTKDLPSAPMAFGSWGIVGIGEDPPPCHMLKQVHGVDIVEAQEKSSPSSLEPLQGDGLFSKKIGEKIAVQTADCLPILASGHSGCGAVHAGWRGLAAGILGTLTEVFRRSDQGLSEVDVILGPCISSAKFEVGPEVPEAFESGPVALPTGGLDLCLSKGIRDRWHIDLGTLALLQLSQLGYDPSRITVVRSCTFENANRWPSYRRDGKKSGRIISWVSSSQEAKSS